MHLVRFTTGERTSYGFLDGGKVRVLAGDPFDGSGGPFALTGEDLPLDAVRLLAPAVPSKVVCVGLNYHTHAREFGMAPPEVPLLFMKPPSAVIGPEDAIELPAASERVEFEGELVVVIGRRLRRASAAEVRDGILGYTCGNDVTARDLQQRDGQWTRAKGFDTFAPLGPVIAGGLDPTALRITTYVNGQARQTDSTANLIFPVEDLVAFISSIMTLLPGDVIFTGTPAGVGPLAPGDRVEVEIEGIGRLANPVRAAG